MKRHLVLPVLALWSLLTTAHSAPAAADAKSPEPPPRWLAVNWNDLSGKSGHVDLMNPEAPWGFAGQPLETGRFAVLRASGEHLYAVCPEQNAIKAIRLDPWNLERTYHLPDGSVPVDIAVADSRTAYVSARTATHLLRLDLETGAFEEAVDLSMFADPDRIPDLGDMVMHEGRLFVQIRRLNLEDFRGYTPPAYLAVIDLATASVIDTDPALPGLQALPLAGPVPKRPMQVVPATRRLFVSATGGFFDPGGIEMIDLDSLRSMGLVVRESDGLTGADLEPFYLVEPGRGFLAFTTDLTLSSHLVEFSLLEGVGDVNLHTEVDFLAPVLVYDPPSDSLFFPSSGSVNPGIHVFEGATGQRLTNEVLPTPGPPHDMVLIGAAPEPPDPASLEISLHPGLQVTGSLGATYQVQYTEDVPNLNWQVLTNLTLRESPTFWCDSTAVAGQPRRFYRVVPVP